MTAFRGADAVPPLVIGPIVEGTTWKQDPVGTPVLPFHPTTLNRKHGSLI